jgi:hypothetical protein
MGELLDFKEISGFESMEISMGLYHCVFRTCVDIWILSFSEVIQQSNLLTNRTFTFYALGLIASNRLFLSSFRRVMHAPKYYFDSTPIVCISLYC